MQLLSLKQARELLLYALDDTIISDEEFVLLCDLNKSTNLDLPSKNYGETTSLFLNFVYENETCSHCNLQMLCEFQIASSWIRQVSEMEWRDCIYAFTCKEV